MLLYMKKLSFVLVLLLLSSCYFFTKADFWMEGNPYSPDNKKIVSEGASLYFENCKSCHGALLTGNGTTTLMYETKPANLLLMSEKLTISEIAARIYNGKDMHTSNEKSNMPAYGQALSRDSIWKLSNYIKSLSSKK